jgi:hypothetical protein
LGVCGLMGAAAGAAAGAGGVRLMIKGALPPFWVN